ncbi:hypothetical protein KUTeg_010701 [Tegillarca granosa]|uniref:Aminopeptidase N-like N-terminal domain-containing protein n=1 Tax=Tegillarca granosa TaxID=220873 RepID=A0ABQ9F1R8_TEGGR|nr:hypothetical protein KUTeg_010701 [Tegillarca granosa]
MFSGDKSFVYGSSTHNQRIDDDYEICKEETVDLPDMPCDDTVYELCCLLMEEAVGVGLIVHFVENRQIQCELSPDQKTEISSLKSDKPNLTGACKKLAIDGNNQICETITPIQYDLELQPNLYGSDPEIFNFEGFVRIKLQCVEKARNITLNSNKLLIDVDSIVVVPDDGNVPNPKYTDLTTDAARQFAVISLDNELIPGKTYTLEMKFSGPLKTDLKGLYLSSYQEAGTTRYLATTQFQPTDARKAFPCFDEPDMKAVFNITLIRKQDWTSISNMELISSKDRGNGMVADSYSLTPRMSTYLVAFVVSQFTYRTNITNSNIRERAWARPESFSETEIALDAGVKILPFYEDLFGIKFPLKKQVVR